MSKRTVVMIIGSMLLMWYTTSPSLHTSKGVASQTHQEQSALYQVKMKEKYVALTFDDGPHPVYTRKVIKVLTKYEAKGTFFVTGERAQRFSSMN